MGVEHALEKRTIRAEIIYAVVHSSLIWYLLLWLQPNLLIILCSIIYFKNIYAMIHLSFTWRLFTWLQANLLILLCFII